MGYSVKQILEDGTEDGKFFSTHPEAKAFIQTLDLESHKVIQILDDIGETIFHYVHPLHAEPTVTGVAAPVVQTPAPEPTVAPVATPVAETPAPEPTVAPVATPVAETPVTPVTPTAAVTETETETVANTSK